MAQSPQRFRDKAADIAGAVKAGPLAADGTSEILQRIADALERLAPPPQPNPDFTAVDAFVWHPEARRLAAMAKLFACQTFRDLTAMAQQVFGGIGFTVEFDIQLYFRRAKQQQLMWANDRALEDAVAAALLD